MYCPKCGKENQGSPRFCRSCGLGLQTISQAMSNELSNDSSTEIAELERTSWHNPLIYGFLMLALGMVIVIFGKKVAAEQLIADLGSLIAVLGIGLISFKGVSLLRSQSIPSARSKTPLESKPTTELPPALPAGEPASVTEQTTRQFEPIYSKRKAE